LAFRSLNQITIIAATASAIAMMEPIIMPAIAPAGRALLFAASKGGSGVGAVELEAALTKSEGVSVLLGVVVGIGPFAGFVSLAYSDHDGFLVVKDLEYFAQSM
jgi:hypothetical protein